MPEQHLGGIIINLKNIIFFENIDKENYDKVIRCLNGIKYRYKSGEELSVNKNVLRASIVLNGIVDLQSIDEDGRVILHDRFFKSESFIFNLIDENKFFVAATDCEVLLLDLEAIFKEEKKECPIRKSIMENIIKLQTNQNHQLNYKVDLYLEKCLRKKIIKYLHSISPDEDDLDIITLPFKRAELASYLSCDRSALSRELSRMQEDGLIEINKNKIRLIKIGSLSNVGG